MRVTPAEMAGVWGCRNLVPAGNWGTAKSAGGVDGGIRRRPESGCNGGRPSGRPDDLETEAVPSEV